MGEIPELKPCPFCGGAMEDRHGMIRHEVQGDCIIGKMGYDVAWLDRWNTRADRATRAARTEGVGEVHRLAEVGKSFEDAMRELPIGRRVGITWLAKWMTARRSQPETLAEATSPHAQASRAALATNETRRQAAEIAELRAQRAERDRLFTLFETDPDQFAAVVAHDRADAAAFRAALRARAEEAGR